MTRNQPADVRWKRFEEVAGRIEAHLAPIGAVVKLDDHVRDKKTGQMRQVDASIRYKVGSVEILITIECRRRSDPQGVTWIEQLAKKRENVGANATIAVASEGFFKTAGISAAFENVYPRTLEELGTGDLDWLRMTHVDVQEKIYSIRQIKVELWEPSPDDEIRIDDKLLLDAAKRLDLYPLFIKTSTGQRFNSYEPIRLSELQGADWFAGKKNTDEVTQSFKWECHDRGISVATNHGDKPVRFIYLEFTVRIERHRIPAHSLFRYKRTEGAILEGVEFDMSAALPNQVLGLYRNPESKQFNLILARKDGLKSNQ
jgi:hypothetical protein